MSSHRKNPKEIWLQCRRAFERRASVAADFAPMPGLIDHVMSRDWSEHLDASISLDNLVIKGDGRMVVVVSKPTAVHFSLYDRGKLVEQTEVGLGRLDEQIDRLILTLLPESPDHPK